MKKLLSVSPFIMLIIPVVLFLALSVALKENINEETLSTTTVVNTTTLVKAGKVSLIQYLLK